MNLPPYDIRRSKRAKRVRISIKGERVELVLPPHVPERLGLAFLESKREWILKSMAALKKRGCLLKSQGVEAGNLIQYAGYWLPIERTWAPLGAAPLLRLDENVFQLSAHPNTPKPDLIKCIERWLADETLERLKSVVSSFVDQGAPRPTSIRLGRNKRAWGSCGPTGVLRIHWRLIQAPVRVFDYVVVHELCHLKHPHHQSSFWSEVENWLPDYSDRHQGLKNWERGERTVS